MAAKDEILLILEKNRGQYISGQFMADALGISRNAVWKAIDRLKKEGYGIASSSDGYLLSASSDRLIKQKLEQLVDNKAFEVLLFDSIDSTNNECKRLVSAGKADFAVLAETQTTGRGRGDKRFFSPEENGLYMSVALKRSLPLEQAVRLTTYTAVCLVEEIRRLTGKDCRIKWVNDIYLDHKKIVGILTEAVTDMESGLVTDLITGIGVNLHPCEVPEELKDIIGFLDCGPLKNELAASLINRLQEFDAQNLSCMDRYRQYSLVLGQEVTFMENGLSCSGIAEAIDDSGALIVLTPDGEKIIRGGGILLPNY